MRTNEQHAARLEEIAVDEGNQLEYFKRANLPEDPFHRKNYDALRAGAEALRERREDIESTTCDMSPKTTSVTPEAPADLDALEALLLDIPEGERWGRYWTVDKARRHIADAAPALIAELRELRAANRWRPIAEGLPEDNVNVLVWDGERACKAFRRHDSWLGDGLYLSRKITHWRPLPDPPESV